METTLKIKNIAAALGITERDVVIHCLQKGVEVVKDAAGDLAVGESAFNRSSGQRLKTKNY